MKKILAILFCFLSFAAGAQTFINRASQANTVQDARLAAQYNFILPRYNDTTEANLHLGTDSIGAKIFTRSDNKEWIRISDPKRWVENGNSLSDGMISPGIVTWTGAGLVFDVSASEYILAGKKHITAATQITLDAADADNPRFYTVYVDTAGAVGAITGVAESAPVIPQVDPLSQIKLTSIHLNANQTTPDNQSTLIYDENTEWTTSKTGTGTVDFADATNPYSGSVDLKISNVSAGLSLLFTNPDGIDTAGIGDVLKLFFYAAVQPPTGYIFQFFSGTNAVSTPLTIATPGYGFNPGTLSTYQNISIPLAAFSFTGGPYWNRLSIKTIGANANAVYFDKISIEKGVYQFEPTDYSNKVDSVTKGGDSLYYWVKGARKIVGKITSESSGNSHTVIQEITTGTDATVADSTTWVIIRPSTYLSGFTLTLPASPTDGQIVDINFGDNSLTPDDNDFVIENLLISPNADQSLNETTGGSEGPVTIDDKLSFRYNSSNSTWYRN